MRLMICDVEGGSEDEGGGEGGIEGAVVAHADADHFEVKRLGADDRIVSQAFGRTRMPEAAGAQEESHEPYPIDAECFKRVLDPGIPQKKK